jgi:hypothetical protein
MATVQSFEELEVWQAARQLVPRSKAVKTFNLQLSTFNQPDEH